MGSYPEQSWLARKSYRVAQRALAALVPANPSQLTTVADLHRAFLRLPFKPTAQDIPGWLSNDEQKALYYLARIAPGPVMEVGAFLGRSTVTIARGIADSGRSRRFLSCELNPTVENFRPLDEHTVGFIYPASSGAVMDTIARSNYERYYQQYILAPGGIIGQLRANLQRHGVDHLVEVAEGDFRQQPKAAFSLIFSDVMHDEAELLRNIPDLRRYLDRRAILACHDTTPANARLLREQFTIAYAFQVHSLFIADVRVGPA
jgi:predicted O-methyltransferase YrrM